MDTITADQFSAQSGVDDWRPGDGGALAEFRTRNFATGARLFAAIAELAEAANHHPDVTVTYPSVRVTLITHSAGGLTAKDVALAQQISAAARDLGVEATA
ncbi:MAG TPA: 4a-hydroxytetrahydrobiopterin dehydratase [Microbacterium sp.]|nr:4a-hydroxytetrahydrobiopterin dehydratase [Microbacterium sp.]